MEKAKVKFIIDVLMVISFLLVGITGIMKLPQVIRINPLNIFRHIDFRLMSNIHDISGVAIVILIIIHLTLNFTWLKNVFLNFFKKRKK